MKGNEFIEDSRKLRSLKTHLPFELSSNFRAVESAQNLWTRPWGGNEWVKDWSASEGRAKGTRGEVGHSPLTECVQSGTGRFTCVLGSGQFRSSLYIHHWTCPWDSLRGVFRNQPNYLASLWHAHPSTLFLFLMRLNGNLILYVISPMISVVFPPTEPPLGTLQLISWGSRNILNVVEHGHTWSHISKSNLARLSMTYLLPNFFNSPFRSAGLCISS